MGAKIFQFISKICRIIGRFALDRKENLIVREYSQDAGKSMKCSEMSQRIGNRRGEHYQ